MRLSAVVRNFGAVREEIVREAEIAASKVYRSAGIDLVWVTPDDLRRQTPVAPSSPCVFASIVLVNLIAREMEDELAPGLLGTVIPGANLLRIAPRRIERSVQGSNRAWGEAIGEVIAHEIGHLLMPQHAHALEGVMKDTLNARTPLSSRVTFLPNQVAEMTAAILARQRTCAQ